MLGEVAKHLGGVDGRELLDQQRARLVKLRDVAKNLRYEYGDLVVEVVDDLVPPSG